MLGLWSRAVVCRRTGRAEGRFVYARGEVFDCHVEPARDVAPTGGHLEKRCTARLMAKGVRVAPGDRIEVADGPAGTVAKVAEYGGPAGERVVVIDIVGDGE